MSQTKIKICGLYREEDINYANQYQPDYGGFIFYPPSHRNVTMEQAKRLRERLDRRIPAVGVFVDEPREKFIACVENGCIDIVQLHGNEDEAYIRSLRNDLPATEIWKAFRVRSWEDVKRGEENSADRILFDYGTGAGKTFDWTLLDGIERPFALAGGIEAGNVKQAIEMFRPELIDVSSGVETERKKDPDKIKEIIERIRSV